MPAPAPCMKLVVRSRGFTLIELMVVVAIIGILAAIAYPSYAEYVRKGKRAEGRNALMELMQQQERWMTQRNTYASFGEGATGTAFKTWSGDSGLASAAYRMGAAACTGAVIEDCVVLTAVPQFTDTAGGNLTVDSLGNRDCTGIRKVVCWQ